MAERLVPAAEGAIEVGGGRRLGYAQWGRANGPAILCFHGGPGSRYLAVGSDCADAIGVRLISLERPGFGLSSPAPDRTITTWPLDVAAVADRLGLEEFAVVGASAASPYVLACALILPDRVTHAGVVAGIVPPDFYSGGTLVDLIARDLGEAERQVRRRFEVMSNDLEGSVEEMKSGFGPDSAVYRRPEVQATFLVARKEAFRQGIEAAVTDLLLINQPWGFSLAEIGVRLSWWHGELDAITPIAAVHRALQDLPECTLTVYPGEGHAIGFNHGEQILGTLSA